MSSIRALNLIDPFFTFPFQVFVKKNNTGPLPFVNVFRFRALSAHTYLRYAFLISIAAGAESAYRASKQTKAIL